VDPDETLRALVFAICDKQTPPARLEELFRYLVEWIARGGFRPTELALCESLLTRALLRGEVISGA
jgi:hypothetical protein